MKANNSLTPTNNEGKGKFSVEVTGAALQNLIRKSVSTPEAAARFTGTLVSAVAASPQLQLCKPATVVAAALRGEGMGLTLGREYHLIPFGDSCAYVIGYKGLIALCLAGNDVADMDCIEVREGEYVGRDPRTKRPKFDFSVYQSDEEAAQHEIIGYYAYVELASGRFRFEYMSVSEILAHASRYSKAFDLDKWRKLQNGDLDPKEAERLKSGSPWYSSPEVMFKKTVIRRLLNSGYVRLANSAAVRDAISYDTAVEEGVPADFVINPDETFAEPAPAQEAAETPESAVSEDKADAREAEKTRTGAKRRGTAARSGAEDAVTSFFDGED